MSCPFRAADASARLLCDESQSSQSRCHAWLSSFAEAESCLTLRVNSSGVPSLSIGQNTDYDLLLFIALFFKANTVPNPAQSKSGKPYFVFEPASLASLINVCAHFDKLPLLGAKNNSYKKFKRAISAKQKFT